MDSLTNTRLLKAKMVEKGFTQGDIAERIGLSPTSVNRKINGKMDFTATEIYRLCDLLSINDKNAVFFANDVD